jgi:hypothetical protein
VKSRLALLSCLVLWAASSPAQMYKWVDERGVTHYSEKPPPGRKAQQIQSIPAAPVSPGAPAASQPARPASTWSDQERDFRRRAIERDQAAQKKQEKEAEERYRAAMRRELCLDAQHAVAALNESRPVYSLNQKGEREYIEDSARPAALQRARQNVETYCKSE